MLWGLVLKLYLHRGSCILFKLYAHTTGREEGQELWFSVLGSS